jgi:hypothetical protein
MSPWSAARVFLVALVVFNLNMRPLASGDTAPAAVLPFAILLDHKITLERFEPWFVERYQGSAYFLHHAHGRTWSSYPIGHALMLTPFYTPVLLIPGLRAWDAQSLIMLARVLEKIFASILAALTVMLFYKLALLYASPGRALLLAFLFAFGTSIWTVAAQALWQHTPSVLCIVASLYFLRTERFGFAAAFAALSPVVRPSNVLFVAASMLVIAFWREHRWRALTLYAGGSLITGSMLAAYNLHVFGHLRGGYSQPFTGDFLAGLSGMLFSPSRGLFLYSPILLLAFLHRPQDRIARIAALFAATHLLLYVRWPNWWGGHCYGPRLLTELAPCLMILLFPLRLHLAPLRVAVVLLGALSVTMHFIGAFYYPGGFWDATPISVDQRPSRNWDWHDTPVSRSTAEGINLRGYEVLSELIRSWIERRPPNFGYLPLASAAPPECARHIESM